MKNKITLIPFPFGKDFAVSFVDDTDFSTVENTKPVYDFLHENGMKGTKTVWPIHQKRNSAFRKKDENNHNCNFNNGSCLEDPNYLNFILDLKQRGFEIALHNVSAGNSYREEILEGLKRFKQHFGHNPSINVFHERNIDNLYCGKHKLDLLPLKLIEKITDNSNYQGHVEGSPYFWGDIYSKTIKYTRLPFHEIQTVNTLKLNPSMPFYDSKRPYVNYWFSNSDGSNCEKFIKLLSESNIKRLEKENGACIIYTHFANGFAHLKNNQYRLNDRFTDAILKLSSYSNAWFPTASELLDRLLSLRSISIKQKGCKLIITNKNNADIYGLTLIIDPGILLKDSNGKEFHPSKEGKVIIDHIPGKSSVLFISSRKKYFRYLAHGKSGSKRRERIKVELINYYGMLKQKCGY